MLSNWEKGRECTDGWTKALQTAVPVQTAVDYLQVKGKAVLANIIPPTNHNSLKVLFSCVSLEEVLFSLDVFFCCSTLFSWDRSMVSNPNWSNVPLSWKTTLRCTRRTVLRPDGFSLEVAGCSRRTSVDTADFVIPSEIYGPVCFQR